MVEQFCRTRIQAHDVRTAVESLIINAGWYGDNA
jgi:hypothetical protein